MKERKINHPADSRPVSVWFLALLILVLNLTGCSRFGDSDGMYSDSEAEDMAQRAVGLIPNGTTKTKREVFTALRLNTHRLTEHQVTGPFKHVYFERARLSRNYCIVWMMTTQDSTPHKSLERKIYGLEIRPCQQ